MALRDAIAELEKEEAMKNPWLRSGTSLSQLNTMQPTSTKGAWIGALADILGGGMRGYGISQERERQQERSSALSDILSQGGNIASQMRERPELFPADIVKSQALAQAEAEATKRAAEEKIKQDMVREMTQKYGQQFSYSPTGELTASPISGMPQESPFKTKTDLALALASQDPRLAGKDRALLERYTMPKAPSTTINVDATPKQMATEISPALSIVEGKKPTNKQKQRGSEILEKSTPIFGEIDNALGLLESEKAGATDFFGENPQQLAQHIARIKTFIKDAENFGAALSPAEERLLDASVGAVVGSRSFGDWVEAVSAKTKGQNPVTGLKNLRDSLQRKIENKLYANSLTLNTTDPLVKDMFRESKLLQKKSTGAKLAEKYTGLETMSPEDRAELEALEAEIGGK